VLLDVLGPGLKAAVALGEVREQQLLDESLDVAVDVAGEIELPGEDLLVDSHGIVVDKGGLSGEHLVDEDSQRPPVDSLSVALVEEYLGGNVFGGSAQSVRLEGDALGEPKVCNLEVTGGVEKQIFGLKVAVNEVLGVKELKDEHNVGGIEFGRAVVESMQGAKCEKRSDEQKGC